MTINFFALPDSIATSILSDWVTTRMLFVLDSAVCNNRLREKFSRLVTYKSFVSYGLTPRDRYELKNYLCGLKKRALKIKNLKIDSCHFHNQVSVFNTMDTMKTSLGDHNCGLQHLDISNCYIDNEVLFGLEKMFKALLSINLNGCMFNGSTFIFDVMGDCFPQLQSIHLSNCMKLNFNRIALLLRSCRDMHSLDISDCCQIRDDSILQIIEVIGSQLQSLNIEGCSPSIKKESLQRLVQCPLLRYLRTSSFEVHISVPYCNDTSYIATTAGSSNNNAVEDLLLQRKHYVLHVFAFLMETVQFFPHVNELIIANRNGKFPDLKSMLIRLMDKSHKLHTLDITSYGISMSELHEVIEIYQRLKYLRVSFCRNLTYTTALELMRKFTPSRIVALRTPDLEYNISDGKLVLKFKELSNELLSDLLLLFPNLHTLELYGTDLITDDILSLVAELCAHSLHSFSLIYCRQISAAAILQLLRACSSLRSLTLCGNKDWFSEQSLLQVLSTSPCLEWFTSGEMSTLSEKTKQQIVKLCPLIRIYL